MDFVLQVMNMCMSTTNLQILQWQNMTMLVAYIFAYLRKGCDVFTCEVEFVPPKN